MILYSIDNYKEGAFRKTPEFHHSVAKIKLKKFGKRSVLLIKSSKEAVKQFRDSFFDFIYIDANHEYESINEDIKLWWTKLRFGGIFSGHDHDHKFPGVVQAVGEFTKREKQEIFTKNTIEDSNWWCKKRFLYFT